ncbi:cytochrome P450 [Microbacterium sp. zg-Y818]|uniref:cytochrome P450 n=1 Tax=unclassified Microbacterium TaxID=2609290 RepID=UPI00214B62B6|nr:MULTISPECIES: cytochrome P450 [unclassified Microbacterium]MCR2799323.1 cytochrome P450 [Microbacterium sp. zg.Y818]WIM21324.1 cytochrome P450 [Microbacterium sp. zg-Y818]
MMSTPRAVYDTPTTTEQAKAILDEAPLARVAVPTGGDVWMVLGHELAREMLADPRVGREPLVTRGDIPYKAKFPVYLTRTLLFKDDPEHARLRRSVGKWFAPRQIRALQSEIEAECERLLDAIEQRGPQFDLVQDYAVPVPIFALTRVLGADRGMAADFLRWNQVLFGTGAGLGAGEVAAVEAECVAYLRAEIARKRGGDGGDLLSVLANIPEGEGTLSEDEMISIAMLILVAGFDNTANFIGNGALALLRHPAQLEHFLEDINGRIVPVVEELLRHGRQSVGSGVRNIGMPFVALEDIEIGDITIRKDEVVMVNRNAANHDDSVFERPLELDVTREENPHLSLSYGVHACLGAPLARLELQASLAALFRRFPHLKVVGEPVTQKETMSEAIEHLPVASGA